MAEPRYSAEIVITYKRRRRPSQSGIENAVDPPGSSSDVQSQNADVRAGSSLDVQSETVVRLGSSLHSGIESTVVPPGSSSDVQNENVVVRRDLSSHSGIKNNVVRRGSSSNVQNGKHHAVPVENSEEAPLILKDKNHNDTVVEPMDMQISEDSALLGSTPVLSKTLEKNPSDNDMGVEPMAIEIYEEPFLLGLTLLSETIDRLSETTDPMKHIVVLSSDDELPAAVKAKRRTPASASGSRKKSKTSRKGKKRARDGAAQNGASEANNPMVNDNVIIIDSDSDSDSDYY